MAQEVLQNRKNLRPRRSQVRFFKICKPELRTPIDIHQRSLGYLRAEPWEPCPEEVMGLMKIAESETDRLIRLTNDILDRRKLSS